MQYMGGKTRQAKHIEEQLLKYKGDCVRYLEPFMGGGAIFARMAPHFPDAALGSDVHPDLMLMWQALLDGWEPPTEVTREEWYAIKDQEPSALRGFVGFGCSFGGRWFEGYASNRRDANFCDTARRGVLKKVAGMRRANVLQAPYTSLEPGPGTLVYCDPPYASTKPYSGTDKFDTDLFWTTMQRWANAGATVLVSEYTAPGWAEEVWRREATVSLNSDTNTGAAAERLFLVHPAPVSDPAPTVEAMDDNKGPWFGAMYDGRCSVNECQIYEGDRIRADGQGGYECEDCGDVPEDELDPEQPLVEGWQTQTPDPVTVAFGGDIVASAAMRRVAEQFPGSATWKAVEILDGRRPKPELPTPDEFMDPATPDVKLNVSGQPPARRDHLKRYIVVDPELGDFRRTKKERKPVGITRATTFNKHAQNTTYLNLWGKANVARGASLRPDILRRAHGLTWDDNKDELLRIVDELETAAGAKVSADEGTFLHAFCDEVDAGLKTWRDAPAMYQQDIKRYVDALAEEGLEPVPGLIERTTFIREYGGVAGTFDRIFYHWPSGQYLVGDLKTGKTMKYAMDETECQIWTYAHGVNQTGIYDWNTDTWGEAAIKHTEALWEPITVSETVGVIVHMPVQGPEAGEVYLRYADLERGKAYADLNHAVKSYPKSKVRPFEMPARGPVPVSALRNENTSETWEHLFAAVQSNEEASVLWQRARDAGVGDTELIRLAGIAQQALVTRVDSTA